ncbi:hypothetical protein HPB50_021003 [Hyalomma asiaticum]|uniref:Uncharacterized protein n=1 Tax=Hyalomma asiaticum TaxID=266040 RepID=A0ACB7T658_HYAAI|nr:hypothetical protein HPB50_021003 [Hyalomma asiaticum]
MATPSMNQKSSIFVIIAKDVSDVSRRSSGPPMVDGDARALVLESRFKDATRKRRAIHSEKECGSASRSAHKRRRDEEQRTRAQNKKRNDIGTGKSIAPAGASRRRHARAPKSGFNVQR